MSQSPSCESCTMPIETGHYCRYCADDQGRLHPFEETFERMIAFQQRRTPNATRADLESATLAFMAQRPAWQDHPRVKAAARL